MDPSDCGVSVEALLVTFCCWVGCGVCSLKPEDDALVGFSFVVVRSTLLVVSFPSLLVVTAVVVTSSDFMGVAEDSAEIGGSVLVLGVSFGIGGSVMALVVSFGTGGSVLVLVVSLGKVGSDKIVGDFVVSGVNTSLVVSGCSAVACAVTLAVAGSSVTLGLTGGFGSLVVCNSVSLDV